MKTNDYKVIVKILSTAILEDSSTLKNPHYEYTDTIKLYQRANSKEEAVIFARKWLFNNINSVNSLFGRSMTKMIHEKTGAKISSKVSYSATKVPQRIY